jgi:hypothetical protein
MGMNKSKLAATYGWKGGVVSSLNALEHLDAGDTNGAIKIIQAHMYASTMTLLTSPDPETRDSLKVFLPDIRQYMAKHSTNDAARTQVELQLKQLLGTQATAP